MTARDLGLFALVCFAGAAVTALVAGPGSLLGPLVFVALTLSAMLLAVAATRAHTLDRSRRDLSRVETPTRAGTVQREDVRTE